MEMIKSAAIKYKRKNSDKEEVVWGSSHSQCIETLACMEVYSILREYETEGFLTTEGRFVSREEAYDIAKVAGQLSYELPDKQLKSTQVNFSLAYAQA